MRVILMAAAVVASWMMPALAETKDEICTAVSGAVGATISARGHGVTLEAALEVANQSFPAGEVLSMARGMIIRIYATLPEFTDENALSDIADAYRTQVYAECLEKNF